MATEQHDADLSGVMAGGRGAGSGGLGNARVFAIVVGVIGVVAAGLIAAMPQESLDLLMWRLWLPQIVSAATPPIGATGRTLLALAVMLPFLAVAGAAWIRRGRFVLPSVRLPSFAIPARTAARGTKSAAAAPSVRRADSHPDAPPRRPIRAAEDLGPPLPIVTVSVRRGVPEPEQPLPVNLDQRLAAFDPIAMPDVPRAPVRAVAPLVPTPPLAMAPPLASEEAPQSVVDFAWSAGTDAPMRVETASDEAVLSFLAMAPEPEPVIEQAPVVEDHPVADGDGGDPEAERLQSDDALLDEVVAVDVGAAAPSFATTLSSGPVADASISSLLDRLERGARRKIVVAEEPEKAESLDDTLVMLRRLAAR